MEALNTLKNICDNEFDKVIITELYYTYYFYFYHNLIKILNRIKLLKIKLLNAF
jgi:hypothetical protein